MLPAMHHAIFAVDMEKYGAAKRTTHDRAALREGLHDALKTAFAAAGFPWHALRCDDNGDGFCVFVPAEFPKALLVERVPFALVEAIRAYNVRHRRQARLRVRVALHAGEISDDAHGPQGPSIITASRLLEVQQLRDALTESRGVLVAITSAWFYREVVWHSTIVDPATFRRIRVKVKETEEDAWIARPDDPYPPAAPAGAARRSWRLRTTAAVVAVAVVGYVAGIAGGDGLTSQTASVVAAHPELVMGDPRTVRPCGLTDANALSRFGEVEISDDYGNFGRCDLLVHGPTADPDPVDVKIEFATGAADLATAVEPVGAVGVQRPPADPDGCTRILLLPDDDQVIVDAGASADPCGMADAAAGKALAVLGTGRLPRRDLPATSLVNEDACALLDTASVTAALGGGPVKQVAAFGSWACDWSYVGSRRLVKVIFDRTADGSGQSEEVPAQLEGFTSWTQPRGRGDDDCLVSIVYRAYVDSKQERTNELVLVDVENADEPPARLCAPARRLAATVAHRLAG
ncbi:hypothetical protein SAMN05421837_103456 [Amycolatopsis pretoriensis]|uniref:Uncharacterized protein n=1 Tax=Amycolatopsis pretoriensis TaxID=218821 RepID=A0A1H5QKX0_9PSEU|nr:hypothetical protein [Amycolatopsis pretoriensis]SEF26709.1 hypothetical protein SAMN05421837_103456 [Amycolatopsis pretoriensis]